VDGPSPSSSSSRAPASRLVFEPGCGIEQPCDLFRAEHHRQLARLAVEMGVLDDIVALERDPEKEPQ
jgi:hypothetical protein